MFCLTPKAAPVLFTPHLKFNEAFHMKKKKKEKKKKKKEKKDVKQTNIIARYFKYIKIVQRSTLLYITCLNVLPLQIIGRYFKGTK